MSVYYVTFRIHDATVNGKTYNQRYTALISAIQQMGMRWDVPTSYAAFETALSLDSALNKLKAHLSQAHDVLLICEIGVKSAKIWGANSDNDIFKLIPYLKKD